MYVQAAEGNSSHGGWEEGEGAKHTSILASFTAPKQERGFQMSRQLWRMQIGRTERTEAICWTTILEQDGGPGGRHSSWCRKTVWATLHRVSSTLHTNILTLYRNNILKTTLNATYKHILNTTLNRTHEYPQGPLGQCLLTGCEKPREKLWWISVC